MRQSKVELYSLVVWATYRRAALIRPSIEPALYACIVTEAAKLGAGVLAINGMPDHVHFAVRLPAKIAVAAFVKQVKGSSSRFATVTWRFEEGFRWQQGYSAFSISRSHVRRVVAYVENQKRHHAAGVVWPEWEEVGEDVETEDA